MEEDDPVLDGDGSTADDLNADTGAGAAYVANQTAFDVADNGNVAQTPAPGGGSTTTTTPASWLTSLNSTLTSASPLATTALTLVGKSTAPAQKVAQPGTGTAAAAATTSGSSKTMYIVLGALALLAAVFFLFRKG